MASCNGRSNEGKHAYILTQKMFEEYNGTKEYRNKLKSMEFQQKNLLDSLSLVIKLMEGKVPEKSPELLAKKTQYNKVYEQVYTYQQEEIERYNDQLWKQINQYVEEYGKANGYAFIYGANGTGNLMYADTTYNITPEVIRFINEKYAGK
jgi:outer membrane protein